MGKPLALLAIALLVSSAAGYSAYFSNSSSFAINSDDTGFPGHFGNYSVAIHVFPYPSYVSVYGDGAGQQSLISELGWLEGNNLLQTSCNASSIAMFSYMDYYCNENGSWEDCAQVGKCAPPAPPAPVVAAVAANNGSRNAGNAQQLALPGVLANAPMAYSEKAGTAPSAAGLPLPDQLVPALGALLAFIVLSYLLLQHQEQVDPQEEKLLENGTRAGILQELVQSDKIPTDLSARLGKSKATIVEHLEALSSAGFVEKLATPGKKFVFYRLTRKGKQAVLRRAG